MPSATVTCTQVLWRESSSLTNILGVWGYRAVKQNLTISGESEREVSADELRRLKVNMTLLLSTLLHMSRMAKEQGRKKTANMK